MKTNTLLRVSLLMLLLIIFCFPTNSLARRHHHGGFFWFHPLFWIGPRIVVHHGDYGILDLDVRPEEAEVYINSKLMGICDEFDGFPDYLYLKTGHYVIKFRHEGYLDYEREIYVKPGRELEFNTRMEKIPHSASRHHPVTPPAEPRKPEPVTSPAQPEPETNPPAPPAHEPALEPEPAPAGEDHVQPGETVAQLQFRVFPKEATVYIDGRFAGKAETLNDVGDGLDVAPGSHRIEILMPGYQPLTQELKLQKGETKQIRVIMDKMSANSDETTTL